MAPRERGMPSRAGSASAIAAGSGKRWVRAPSGAASGVPKRSTRRPVTVRAPGDRHLLADDRAQRELPAVAVPGDAQARPRAYERAQDVVLAEQRGDADGVRVEIQQPPRARRRRREVAQVVQAQATARLALAELDLDTPAP